MSQQLTFADSEFSSKRRQTRKEIFLSRMDNLLPWTQLLEVIEPFYPKAGNGRRPYPLETMFRIHCMQQWYSLSDEAMEAHIGVDAKSGLTHTLVTTAANEHDLNQLKNLLHGDEEFISGDAGYQGAEKREELEDTNVEWLIAERPGKVRALKKHPRKNKTAINIEYLKASIRAKVEHPFRIIKCQFGFIKARYKGLTKNDSQLAMLFTLANLFKVDGFIKARYKGLTKNDSQLAMLFTLANLFKVDQMLRRQPRSV
ncbi:IS5 family transposase [Shewanella sp. Isolate7]|uniref:IS5 family transposase n=1 Tax=Shewanella sp. Isolate7 TaxID=2908528 RepID=UPI001EFDB133|nr:IS5 family transposase [Shewanella sp. Isolate7]MCG9720385.1 IS5 family transposase [Shewanella sp. Isolate7]